MKWAVIVGVLALAGCQTQQIHEMNYSERKALASEIVQRCIDQGVDPRSKEFSVCSQAEVQAEHAKRQNNVRRQRAFAQAMSEYGQNMQRQAAINAATMPRTVNCRSRPTGAGTYSTSCY